MKDRLAAGLIRLYPARWRAEYGEELAEVLGKRPLGAGGVGNVFCNAIWQQLRLQEPWLTLPQLMAALLVLGHAMRVVTEPGGSVGFRFGDAVGQGRGDVVTLLVAQPMLMILYSGLIGWLGGLAGHLVRRTRKTA